MKTVVVKSAGWTQEFRLDEKLIPEVDHTLLREAAIQSVENASRVAVIIECYEKRHAKKVEKHVIFNAYYVLLAARKYDKAKVLREKFKTQFKIDLQSEDRARPSDVKG